MPDHDATIAHTTSRYHGVLGTVVELTVAARSETVVDASEAAVMREILRLEGIFTVFDEHSELRRWQRRECRAGSELTEVLELAATWQDRSHGAFNAAIRPLVDLWDAAARTASVPTQAELDRVCASISGPPFALEGCTPVPVHQSAAVDLNALAKGWIVDRATGLGMSVEGVVSLTVNAGGDLLHRGADSIVAGIEDPHRPYDNVPPLLAVSLADRALATSGSNRRGRRVAGRWYGHVLDPRTGRPADHVASASVVACDAATADALATILTILPTDEGLALTDSIADAACCVIGSDGTVSTNERWDSIEVR